MVTLLMIEIVLEKDARGRILSLRCDGHAGFSAGEEGGVDIVCAAVSALTGYLGLTFAEVLGFPEAVAASDGHFGLIRSQAWTETTHQIADVLLKGWERSARGLEENYSGWVRVVEVSL